MIIAAFFLLLFISPVFSDTLSRPGIFESPFYPCSTCHNGMQTNPSQRKLSFHSEIVLNHGNLWCLDCHNPSNRDRLRYFGGKTINFDELYRLCGICHGVIYTQWSKGIHGKRTGQWDGQRNYLLCTNCHNPHSPLFKAIKPEPPPLRPEMTLGRY